MEINRNIFKQLERDLFKKEISILLGARQVGKSTLMRQLERRAKDLGLTTRFYNLELSSDLEELSGLRETSVPKGMRLFLKNYPRAPYGIVFSEEFRGEAEAEGRPVLFRPLAEAAQIEYLQSPL